MTRPAQGGPHHPPPPSAPLPPTTLQTRLPTTLPTTLPTSLGSTRNPPPQFINRCVCMSVPQVEERIPPRRFLGDNSVSLRRIWTKAVAFFSPGFPAPVSELLEGKQQQEAQANIENEPESGGQGWICYSTYRVCIYLYTHMCVYICTYVCIYNGKSPNHVSGPRPVKPVKSHSR